jgi:ribonuclease Z
VIDGAVSYSLEWAGLKFVFGGDTYPNQWFVKYAKDADIAIHECFVTVPQLIERLRFPVSRALDVGTQIHTAPPAFGKVMSLIKPRHAIAYHFFNDFDTSSDILQGILSTYNGPLTMAKDMLVWNVTKDKITVREVIFQEDVWPPPPAKKPMEVDRSIMETTSPWIVEQNLDLGTIIQQIYERTNKIYGTDYAPEG